jgi:guanyl-specific ribonuclease Sa
MAITYKVLGQSAPSATTNTDVYTVGAGKQTTVSTITVCNRNTTTSATYRIAVRPDGDTLANEHYIAYDATVGPKDTVTWTIGITADASDVVTVYASSADLSFNVFGVEIA